MLMYTWCESCSCVQNCYEHMRNEPAKNAYALGGANGKYSSKKENYQREIKYHIVFVNFQTIN